MWGNFKRIMIEAKVEVARQSIRDKKFGKYKSR